MPLVFGKSLYLHTLFFTVISLKTYRIDMSKILIIDDEVQIRTLLTRMMELETWCWLSRRRHPMWKLFC